MQFHTGNPAALVEATFERIRLERMQDLPLLNPALAVAAVDFARHEDDWRGALVTPWGINLLLLPATPAWRAPASHERAFRVYPAGTFAFLANREDGLGAYLACPLISDMKPFADQDTALQAARACLIALDQAPESTKSDPDTPRSPARRSFLFRVAK